MPTTTLYATSHLSGTCSTPGNALGASDGTWTTDVDNTSWASRWQLGSLPSGSIATGTQTLTIRCRKQTGSGTPMITVSQYSGGSLVTTLVTDQAVTSLTGEDIVLNFTTSQGDPDVEIDINCTAVGGAPAARATVQIDAIAWSATYGNWLSATASTTISPTAAATPAAMSKAQTATVTVTPSSAAAGTAAKSATASVTVTPIAVAVPTPTMSEASGDTVVGITAAAYAIIDGQLVNESWGPIPILTT